MSARRAELYRMVMDDHVCPYGLKAKSLLERKGFELEDHPLRTREETDAFKEKHGVETTPQIFLDGERIGGYDALREHLELDEPGDETTYQPVIAVFGVAFAMALAVSWAAFDSLLTVRAAEWFIAFSMCLLAMLKLRDLEAFTTQFLGYDLLSRRFVPYAYFYPFAEFVAGALMIAGVLIVFAAPLAITIGTLGAVSVFKAVYVDKRELRCACVGGHSRVPLGFVSLTENLMMIAMGGWMLLK